MEKTKCIFDYQTFHILEWFKKQPDLETMVRLFLDSLPYRPLKIYRYFHTFYLRENEALLGTNRKNLEIRVFFYKTEKLPNSIIIRFAVSHLNPVGYLQSILFRILFFFLLQFTARSARRISQ
jgi:hypothetical protein